MPNERVEQEQRMSCSPPPYSSDETHLASFPGNLDLSHLEEQSSSMSCLQLKLVTSSIDNWNSTPYECSCVLEDRFLLLGHIEGIQVVDLHDTNQQPKTIIWTRARQMIHIESCRVVLILAGRYKQVRCYSYDALLRLVYAVLSLEWTTRRDTTHDIPTHQAWELVASLSGKAPEDDIQSEPNIAPIQPTPITSPSTPTTMSNSNGFALNLKERLVKKKEEKMPSKQISLVDQLTLSGITKLFYVCNDIILQDFYYKLSESKDALDIQTYQTSTYVFAAIRHRDKIVLWQRKRDHPLRPFYRLKVFWIPTEAKSIAFADDRSTLRHILAVFSSEATAIELRDSKVQSVPIDPTLERIYQTTWIRDQYEHQLGSPKSPINSPIPQSLNNNNEPYPTLPASLSVPPIQWTSLIQLPFYPDSLPATMLTTDYSIPPSYATVITSLSSAAPPDPVALPSTDLPQLFFATLSKQSYIIDLSGALFSTQVYRWTEAPVHIEFIQIDPNTNDWYVVGFGTETVEVLQIKTGQSIQSVMRGVPVKFLGRWDVPVPREDNKRKPKHVFHALFWSSCASSERVHVYMLKSTKSYR